MGVVWATVYARSHSAETEASDLLLSRPTDEEYPCQPFYDNNRMVVFLQAGGYGINRKRRTAACKMGGRA